MATEVINQVGKQITEIAPNEDSIVVIAIEDAYYGYMIAAASTVFALTDEFANLLPNRRYTFELRSGENLFIKGTGKVVLDEGEVI